MKVGPPFTEQVRLLVMLLPHVAKQDCFALKGGTAINLFLRDMPRLSVDIDLAYIPVENRDTSLARIDDASDEHGFVSQRQTTCRCTDHFETIRRQTHASGRLVIGT